MCSEMLRSVNEVSSGEESASVSSGTPALPFDAKMELIVES